MEIIETIFEEKLLDCIPVDIAFLKHGNQEKNLQVEPLKDETTTQDKLQVNSSSTASAEAMTSSYEFMLHGQQFGNSKAAFSLPELYDDSKLNEASSLNFSNLNDLGTKEYISNSVRPSTDLPNYSDHLNSHSVQSSLSMFNINETFHKKNSFSASAYDANLEGVTAYEESHHNLWLDNELNPPLITNDSGPLRPKKENFADHSNIFNDDFDYTFLEDSFCNPLGNIDTAIANEKLGNVSLYGRDNKEVNIMDSNFSEPGCFMDSNSYSEASNTASFDVKEENLVTIKEEPGDNDVTSLIDLYDETLDPDLEAAMQRCIKITKILSSSESSNKSIKCHKNTIRRNNSFDFLRPALKKRFLVPPKSPSDQPMISMKSVHYKWPDKAFDTQRSRTETIHFAMYAAIKKKYLKETQKVVPSHQKFKTNQNLKSKLRRFPIANKAFKVNKEPSGPTTKHCIPVATLSSVSAEDEEVAEVTSSKKDSSPAEGANSMSVYSIGDTGCKITIQSSVSVDVSSFSPKKFQANPEITIITPTSWSNQPDYLIESTINSITNDINNGKNINVFGKYDSLKGKVSKKQHLLKIRRKSILNTKNVVKIQIFTNSPKRMVVTRVKEPNTTDDSNDTSSGFQLIKSILSHLDNLSSDLVKQICLPLKALQRGSLTESEINCIIRQGNLLKILSELTNNHKGCLLNGCSTCEVIRMKKAELHRLMTWSHQTDYESNHEGRNEGIKSQIINIYPNASEQFDLSFCKKSIDADQNCNSRVKTGLKDMNKLSLKMETSINSTLKKIDEKSSKDAPPSHIQFNLERLDIGKFSLMSSKNDEVIKVFCNSESVVYEIDLHNSKSQPATLAIIRLACKDIIGVNMVNNVITIEFKSIPVLCLFDSKNHKVPMEKVSIISPTSLLTSLKKQLNVYFLHKLSLKENIEREFKKFVSNSWPQAKLTSNTEDDILQKSYYDGKYLLYEQREKRQKHLESLLRQIEEFIAVKGVVNKEYQSCCECVNGCRSSLDCWCCRKGNACLNCCCLSCTNPLNVLNSASVDVQEAKLDVCLMQNIYDIQDMKLRDILRQENILSCCGASMTTKDLIPNIKECDVCGAPLSYSWCTQVVFNEENKQRNHCILCAQCQPSLYLHCSNCSTCALSSTTGKCTQCM